MTLMEFVSNLSSFATLHSWISEQYEKRKGIRSITKLNNIDLEVKEKILKIFYEEEEIEYIDNYIAMHSHEIKDKGLSILFSREEREAVIAHICELKPMFSKDKVTIILEEYFNLLNRYLNENLSFETKFLRKCIKEESNRIINTISEIIPEKNIFNDKKYSSIIIGKCNAINTLLIKSKYKKELLRRPFSEDYLTADNLEDVFLKLDNLFRSFDIEFLNSESKIKSMQPLDAIYNFVLTQTSGSAINLVEFYSCTIRHVMECINNYTYKNKELYISLGALGLVDDNTDSGIYRCIIRNLEGFFDRVIQELIQCWKDIDYKANEDNTINQMNKHLYYKIKWYFNKDTKNILKMIYENKNMLDTELADKVGMSIVCLRKLLYSCTEEFLGYKYADNKSTSIFIYSDYEDTIKEYYRELFEEN